MPEKVVGLGDSRDPDAPNRRAQRKAVYRQGANIHLTATAIANCTLCDPSGYRPNGRVCDHVDRSATAAAGSARVREAMAKSNIGGRDSTTDVIPDPEPLNIEGLRR